MTSSTPPRSRKQRTHDTLDLLTRPEQDAWVTSASTDDAGRAEPYVIPLSIVWHDGIVLLACPGSQRTARNIARSGVTRLAVGGTRDVVLIDAVLEQSVPVADAPAEIGEAYAAQADWDPRRSPDGYVYLVLRPHRIQAWRDEAEIPGRTLMRDGTWL